MWSMPPGRVGEMLEKVTPTTASLLNYWFGEGFCNERARNFHEGQRQAILNIIYLHEVMGENCVMDAYQGHHSGADG